MSKGPLLWSVKMCVCVGGGPEKRRGRRRSLGRSIQAGQLEQKKRWLRSQQCWRQEQRQSFKEVICWIHSGGVWRKGHGSSRVRPCESELKAAGAWWVDEVQVWGEQVSTHRRVVGELGQPALAREEDNSRHRRWRTGKHREANKLPLWLDVCWPEGEALLHFQLTCGL